MSMASEDLSVVVTGRTAWDVPLVQYLLGLAAQETVLPGDRARLLVEVTDVDLLACGQALMLLQANIPGQVAGAVPLTVDDLVTLLQLSWSGNADLPQELKRLAAMWRDLVAQAAAGTLREEYP
jgi:hypothetical protein